MGSAPKFPRSLRVALALALALALGVGCGGADGPGDGATSGAAPSVDGGTATPPPEPIPPPTAADLAAWQACAERRTALAKEPALPGAPAFEKVRAEMARPRGRPVLWRRAPPPVPELEARLAKGGKPLTVVRDLVHKYRKKPEALRHAVLRDGYLFHEDVATALALVEQLSLVHMFDEEEIWLARGGTVQSLRRKPKDKAYFLPERFVYTVGDRIGAPAEILHGDRVATTREEVEREPLALDLIEAVETFGFDRIKPEHLTDKALVADVRYGPSVWVPAVLDADGPHLRLACEVLTPELVAKKQAFLAWHKLERLALERMREVVRLQIDEELPFDAPKSGEEAAEGDRRREFDRAYKQGLRYYTLDGGVRHDVYDEKGRPLPPQVCIDFLVDTIERAGGKWYAPMTGNPMQPSPSRTAGAVDFDKLSLDNRRSVASFVVMTKAHPELFEVWENPKTIPFTERTEFFNHLAENADELRPGDLIIIYGTKKGKPHYHSMILLEYDPVSGVPTLIVSNAVIPREQTLEGIMQISPKRSFKYRLRLKRPWVEELAKLAPAPAPTPPTEG